MYNISKWKLLFAGILVVGLSSCLKDDIDKLSDTIPWNPDGIAPFINSEMSIDDIAGGSEVGEDEEGVVVLSYIEEDIYQLNALDYVKIASNQPVKTNVFPISAGTENPIATGSFDIDFATTTANPDAELRHISFDQGLMEYTFSSLVGSDLEVLLTFPGSVTAGGTELQITLDLDSSGGVVNGTADISDVLFDLTQSATQPYNIVVIDYVVNNVGGGIPADVIVGSFRFIDLDVAFADGYFGQIEVPVEVSNRELESQFFKDANGDVTFTNPIFNILTKTTIGANAASNMEIDGVNEDGEILRLTGDIDNVINGATVPGETAFDKLTYQKDIPNCNVVEFTSHIPSSLIYSGNIIVNPEGNVGQTNFAQASDVVDIDFQFDLPMEFSMNDFSLVKEQELPELEEEDLENVKELYMHFNMNNDFPMDARVHLILMDTIDPGNIVYVDTIEIDNFVYAAPLEADGRVDLEKVERTTSIIELTQEERDNLIVANKGGFRIFMSTPEEAGENRVVKIYSDYRFDIRVAMQAVVDLN